MESATQPRKYEGVDSTVCMVLNKNRMKLKKYTRLFQNLCAIFNNILCLESGVCTQNSKYNDEPEFIESFLTHVPG